MHLTGFDIDGFLRDDWQRRPRLIRNPWTAWVDPLDPDDLAGLAGDAEIEARLVTRTRRRFKLSHGPFAAARFARLGKHPWTLLVQAVDHAVPAVAALRDAFGFIPNWRVDDVMVSYATDGGGVGPHFDQYDVFLIQGRGQRRWRVGGRCDAATPLVPDADLRLLADFTAVDEWVLGPGDILYLPPGVAHDGVAVGDDCMTYSIGFRAPSRADLVGGWCDDVLAQLSDDDRFADPGLQRPANPGEIAPAAIARLRAMITAKLGDATAFADWFGRYASTRKYPEMDWTPEVAVDAATVRDRLAAGALLYRNPASRFVFLREGAVVLFVDGARLDPVDAALAEHLCAAVTSAVDATLAARDPALVVALVNGGSLSLDP